MISSAAPTRPRSVTLKEPLATEGCHGILPCARDNNTVNIDPDRLAHAKNFANELRESRLREIKAIHDRRWTSEARAAKSLSIRSVKPWTLSSGPKTAAGKGRAALNAWKGGDPSRDMKKTLSLHGRFLREVELLLKALRCGLDVRRERDRLRLLGHVATQRLNVLLHTGQMRSRHELDRRQPVLQSAIISDLRMVNAAPILNAMQHTLKNTVELSGIGLHSGKTVSLRLRPAPVDFGIVFKRIDLGEGRNLIPAKHDRVVDTRLCTLIANESGARVGTIEHLMAAFRGLGIDNVLVELDAPEVPVMDGSSKPFIDEIDKVGLVAQSAPRRAIKILKEIIVRDGDKTVRLSPSNVPVFAGRIEFAHADIGVQDYTLKLVNGNFRHDVSDCRTFGFYKEAEMLRAAGLGLGGSLENAIVLDDNGVMNPDGLRCSDEFIRHKILDAVGDLYLAGGPVIGAYEGFKAGHALNNAILHAMFADPSAWAPVDMYVDIAETEAAIYTPMGAAKQVALH